MKNKQTCNPYKVEGAYVVFCFLRIIDNLLENFFNHGNSRNVDVP